MGLEFRVLGLKGSFLVSLGGVLHMSILVPPSDLHSQKNFLAVSEKQGPILGRGNPLHDHTSCGSIVGRSVFGNPKP